MKIKFRFYKGEERNPFYDEREKAFYAYFNAHNNDADGIENDKAYIAANSKYKFWELEKMFSKEGCAEKIEEFWNQTTNGEIPMFIKKQNVEEPVKALLVYMMAEFSRFSPMSKTVDFELYFS